MNKLKERLSRSCGAKSYTIKGSLKEALKKEYKKRIHLKKKTPPIDKLQIAKIASILD